MFKLAQIILAVLLFSNVTFAYAASCSATTHDAIANKIANGHAWRKHKDEFVEGKIMAGLAMPASPKVTSSAEFKSHLLSVMSSGAHKNLSGGGRKAYWDSATGTIVIYDPASNDCGTSFRPTAGQSYYNNQ